MARTGLMPTSPSPSLKFRTAGFPQYGFKVSLSDRAFQSSHELKSTPDMRSVPRCCSLPFARPRAATAAWALSPTRPTLRRAAVQAAVAALPQGSLAPERVLLSPSITAYYDPIRQSREHATISRPCRLYAAPSLCGSASATRETFPTFPAALSMRAIDLTPVGSQPLPVVPGARCQASSSYHHRVATHDHRLCQLYPAGSTISVRHRSRYAAARLFALPS